MESIILSKKLNVKKSYDIIVCGGGVAGVAAAHAACQAIRERVGVSDVNIKALQNTLEKDDVMIHFPDEYVPDDKTVIIHGKNAAEIDGGHN